MVHGHADAGSAVRGWSKQELYALGWSKGIEFLVGDGYLLLIASYLRVVPPFTLLGYYSIKKLV